MTETIDVTNPDQLAGIVAHAIDANHGRPTFAIAREVVAELLAFDEQMKANAARVEVFSRPECLFAYCGHPDLCAEACQVPVE